MIKGIGVDIVEIARIKKAIEAHPKTFIKRILTESEIKSFEDHFSQETHIAGRFAAKEAISKALGCGIGEELSWQDLEVLNDNKGKPYVNLSGNALERFPDLEIQLSISHDKSSAIAFAIVTRKTVS